VDALANSIVPIGLYGAAFLFVILGVGTGVASVESFRHQSVKSMPSPVGMGAVALVSFGLALACYYGAR
jgi:ABC-type transport system involved in cytochrome c biogenesis permease subunit